MFRSIKTKYITTQLVFILFMAVAIGLVTYIVMFRSLRDSQLQYLNYATMHIEEKINISIAGKEQLLEKIATSEMVISYNKKQSENILVYYFNRYMSEFAVLAYVNDKNIKEAELVNGKTPAKILDKADSELIEQLRKNPNKPLNKYLSFSPDINGPCIEFGFLNRNFFDEFEGIILGKVSIGQLFKNIQQSSIGKTGSVILLDSQGTILSCKDPNSILQRIVIDGTEAKNAAAGVKTGGSGRGRAKILGGDSYFAYTPVRGKNWAVMTLLPYREFATDLNTLRNTVFTVSLSMMAVGSILSWLLAKNITGPILKLVKGTTAIAKGDFSHKIHTTSQDEIGTLAESFNNMVEDLARTTTSVINLNREISERRKAEVSLIKSEKRFEEVADNSGDWIWEVNADGLYTYSSPVAEKILGYKPEEFVGKKYFYDFFAPDAREELKKAAFETFAKHENFKGLTNFNIHKNGSRVTLETHGTPIIDDEGNLCGYRGADRDITERKLAEEAVKNLNNDLKSTVTLLTQSNRQLREFAHLAAHDLKTPLRGIVTLAQWLVEDYREKFDDEGRRQVDLLIKRAMRLNEIVDAILEYSTIARNSHRECLVDLNALLATVLAEIEPPPSVKITINKKLPIVVCEEAHLRQVFYNLITNAVKFMDKPDGLITIDCTDREDVWVFSVSDNGPGIAPQHFERIFRLFQTLDDPDQSNGSGTGLTITRKIVELYSGKIWLDSELNHGSTFFFTLPKSLNVTDNKEQILAHASC